MWSGEHAGQYCKFVPISSRDAFVHVQQLTTSCSEHGDACEEIHDDKTLTCGHHADDVLA